MLKFETYILWLLLKTHNNEYLHTLRELGVIESVILSKNDSEIGATWRNRLS
jgi:hypothetical protein